MSAETLPIVARRKVKPLSDADQIRIWQASINICDGRGAWQRALAKAIRMILARDPKLKAEAEGPSR